MTWGSLAAFWAVSVLFVITPGADWAYAITAGLRHRSPVPAVLGMLAGHLLATLIVAAGVGALVSRVPVVLTVMTVLGALYLIWLGVGLLRHPATVPGAEAVTAASSPLRQAAKGLGISGLNPKVFLLFLALLPQFTDTTAPWPVGVQMGTLGLLHVANCAVVYLVVGFGARRVLSSRPAAARVVTRLSGIAMIVIGVILVVEKIIR
ncbi:LysE family translocator [Frigoribacterium sp. RIT-PI-h]|uniref:LysE family translocator n=1 Tax=Frigoribacterium sp. RIT-PI-h TaxID=1690245 RepID=UPI0006B89D44|nr:LysE family translocator [Frigoribacterium sp. RIT-PI-h]KPG82380.1 lysine transporter LysE [Frigoribacterium sp. RIT-PI-h]